MRNRFPGHFAKNNVVDLSDVWDGSLLVFDTSILHNLYRYSDDTREEFLKILEELKEFAWLPNRVAEEFLTGRNGVIEEELSRYDSLLRDLKRTQSDLKSRYRHPFVSEDLRDKSEGVFNDLVSELEENKTNFAQKLGGDYVRDRVANVFDGKVGYEYDHDTLLDIFKKGEDRYKERTPPGFKDANKSGTSDAKKDLARKFGDLIIWLQTIDYARDNADSVIFVTDDNKEDWWEFAKDKKLGPHPGLIQEFKELAGADLFMCKSDEFLELAREKLDETLPASMVDEVREVSRGIPGDPDAVARAFEGVDPNIFENEIGAWEELASGGLGKALKEANKWNQFYSDLEAYDRIGQMADSLNASKNMFDNLGLSEKSVLRAIEAQSRLNQVMGNRSANIGKFGVSQSGESGSGDREKGDE